mgnify:CR=1 FL=1
MDLKTAERAPYEAKRLIYPIVGLSVTAVIITVIYIYTWREEKRAPTQKSQPLFFHFSNTCCMTKQGIIVPTIND